MDYIERIADMGACAPAMAWLRSEQHPTLQAAWDACPRSNWMLWLLAALGHPAYSDAQDAAARDARAAARDARAAVANAAYAAAYDAVRAAAVRAVVPVAPTLP